MYSIGQIFENKYPTDCADWCNQNNCYIKAIENLNGARRYQILEVPAYVPIAPKVETEQQKAERIAMLRLTSADVERAIYKVKRIDFQDILEMDLGDIDKKELRIELKANHFYRGNPYINAIGQLLGFTEEQLDMFFADGNPEHLRTLN